MTNADSITYRVTVKDLATGNEYSLFPQAESIRKALQTKDVRRAERTAEIISIVFWERSH